MHPGRVVDAAPGMTRREQLVSAGRGGALGVAFGLGAALVVAVAIASWTSAAEGWWDAGYLRLVADEVSARFDVFALPAAAVGMVAGAGAGLLGVRAGRRARAAAVFTAVVIAAVRGAIAADAWRASRGPNVLLISI